MTAAKKMTEKPSADIYQKLENGIVALYGGKYEAAKSTFEEILGGFPGEIEVLAKVRPLLAVCHRNLTDGTSAAALDSPEALYNLAVFHHNNGDYQQAVAALEQALGRGGERHHYIHYSLAAAYARMGNREASIKSLKQATQLSSEVKHLASQDTDFSALHGLDAFDQLLG